MRFLIVLLVVTASAAGAGELYRWVDEEGNVYYSDQVPPEHAARARDKLNDQGIRVDSVEAAPSPEQLAAAREKARQLAEARQQKEEQRRRDNVLLNSFDSVEAIENARDAEIAALQRTVDMTRTAANSHRRQMRDLVERAAELQRSGRPVPEQLVARMRETREKIHQRLQYIEEKRVEQATVFAEYEQDIVRYRELTGESEGKE